MIIAAGKTVTSDGLNSNFGLARYEGVGEIEQEIEVLVTEIDTFDLDMLNGPNGSANAVRNLIAQLEAML